MPTPTLSKADAVWTITMDDGENRMSPDYLSRMAEHLDEIAESTEPAVLVTVGTGKFFSNGLDLDWLTANPGEFNPYIDRIHALLDRVLTLPVPTVAAINGHAFGGGALLAMAHDFRVMRTERGFFCFPEVDVHIPFTEGMASMVQAKITPQAAVASMTTGARFGGDGALAAGLVDAAVDESELLAAASAKVADLAGKDRTTLGQIKRTMFARAHEALNRPHS